MCLKSNLHDSYPFALWYFCNLDEETFMQSAVFNSLWPSDAIWWQGSRSTLVQVMACCRYWLIISEFDDIFLKTISLEMPPPSITKIRLNITYIKLYLNVPGANELNTDITGSSTGTMYHYNDVIMGAIKSPALRLFTQPFIPTQIKENIKALHHWPLWEEFTGDRWIPRTNGQ